MALSSSRLRIRARALSQFNHGLTRYGERHHLQSVLGRTDAAVLCLQYLIESANTHFPLAETLAPASKQPSAADRTGVHFSSCSFWTERI